MPRARRPRIPWLWAIAGAAWMLSAISFAGPFFLPVAVAATVFAVRHDRSVGDRTLRWPTFLGGIGLLIFAIGALHLFEERCPEVSGPVSGPMTGPGPYACATFDPVPWLAIGTAVVVVAALLGWWRVRRTDADDGAGPVTRP